MGGEVLGDEAEPFVVEADAGVGDGEGVGAGGWAGEELEGGVDVEGVVEGWGWGQGVGAVFRPGVLFEGGG